VSLILEALRKLERDKDAPERGFVVMTHIPWVQGRSSSRLVGIGAIALALALGILAMALWRGRAGKPLGPEAKVVATAPPSVAPPAPQASPIAPRTPPPFDAKALALESVKSTAPAPGAPAAPLAEATPKPRVSAQAEVRLNAISQKDGQPVAVVNDRLVHEGDAFDGIRVIRIGETEVEVEVRGQHRILTF
jgi:hypothetical protein